MKKDKIVTNPSIEDIPYRTIEGTELKARLFRPDTTEPSLFVIDVHGGAWGNGDRLNNEVIHQDFADNGIGVFALDFRLSSEAQFPAPVDDVNYGVRWFKANASALGLATSLIGYGKRRWCAGSTRLLTRQAMRRTGRTCAGSIRICVVSRCVPLTATPSIG